VGDEPSLADLADAITQLSDMFQRLTGAAQESVVGIIGELAVILCASDSDAAALAWRVDPDERYDFAHGLLRLEVKSSSTRRRVHDFSFEQCDVPVGCKGVVASIFVEKSSGGLTLEGLLWLVEASLTNSAAKLHVQQTLARTLGSELLPALAFAFDQVLATSELAFFDLDLVPAVRRPIPDLVSHVRFTSDMGAMAIADPELLTYDCPDFVSFAPRDKRLWTP
jgi:hypothetical protein